MTTNTLRHMYRPIRRHGNNENVFTSILDQRLPIVVRHTLCSVHYDIKYALSYDIFKQTVL